MYWNPGHKFSLCRSNKNFRFSSEIVRYHFILEICACLWPLCLVYVACEGLNSGSFILSVTHGVFSESWEIVQYVSTVLNFLFFWHLHPMGSTGEGRIFWYLDLHTWLEHWKNFNRPFLFLINLPFHLPLWILQYPSFSWPKFLSAAFWSYILMSFLSSTHPSVLWN